MFDDLILIFVRNPELGKVKSRLAASIGNKNALEIYEYLLNHTKNIVQEIKIEKRVLYADEIIEEDIWDKGIYQKQEQFGQDLGARMKNAFASAFEDDYKKVVVIGTDLYDLEPSDIELAFKKLDHHDIVIGPANDGGYYLLGLKFIPEGIFINKKWGTSSVLSDTLVNIEQFNVAMLDFKNDIDTIKDIKNIPDFQKYI